MTAKRFEWNERIEGRIVEEFVIDNLTKKELDEEDMCDLLNEFHEEKEIAIDGIKIADELIKKYGSEELKHEWKKEVTVKYR